MCGDKEILIYLFILISLYFLPAIHMYRELLWKVEQDTPTAKFRPKHPWYHALTYSHPSSIRTLQIQFPNLMFSPSSDLGF
jgi:hypothetical protein